MTWRVEELAGSAGELHARSVPLPARRSAWILEVDRPALVLGSTQRDEVVDGAACAAAGVEVARRRSGGGAVLLRPGEALWVDLIVPRGDPLWDDDVGRASHWLGELWAGTLATRGLPATGVHRSGLLGSPWSDLVCFAGLGPGEVTSEGAKVVGISQRRTRDHARFQCVVLARWRPGGVLDLLDLAPDERARARADLAGVARGVDLAGLVEAFTERLRRHG